MSQSERRSGERRNFLGRGNDPFACLACGVEVKPLRRGFRSHCPACLWSRHVDVVPGDRAAHCQGLMRPVRIDQERQTWFVIHVCEGCGIERRNRLALDDPLQPDDWDRVIELSTASR